MYAYLGHLKSEKQGLQSTKSINKSNDTNDYFPLSLHRNKKYKEVFYAACELSDIAGCIDLTHRFPKTSSSRNQHTLVGYNYDGNCMHAKHIKNRHSYTITQA